MNVNRKRKCDEGELESLSKEVSKRNTDNQIPILHKLIFKELIERIQQLTAHNNQLRNTIRKQNDTVQDEAAKKKGRPFDFSR